MKLGKYDTNTSALRQRIASHKRYGSKDLNEWIFKCVELQEGLWILDLGCGTGNQTLPLAQIVGNSGHLFAVDISNEALGILSQQAQELGLSNRISLLQSGLDEFGRHLKHQRFDRVLASYSLYYAQNPRKVFETISNLLREEGLFFFCGPSRENNAEIKRFHYALLGEQHPPASHASVVMEETGQRLSREFFSSVEVFTFENPLRFDSAESLYTYWSSHNMYDEKLEAEFKAAATEHFRATSSFRTTKHVIGVRARK